MDNEQPLFASPYFWLGLLLSVAVWTLIYGLVWALT